MLPDGLVIAGYLPREDVRDAFIGGGAKTLMDLPHGARVGVGLAAPAGDDQPRCVPTSRSSCCAAMSRPGCARSKAANSPRPCWRWPGLKRLGLADRGDLDPAARPVPARLRPGRHRDHRARRTMRRVLADLAPICDAETGYALAAERAFLHVLDGSCRTPIAGHAVGRGRQAEFLRHGPAQGRLRGL